METFLWGVQGFLACVVLIAGVASGSRFLERRAHAQGIVMPVQGLRFRLIGVAEVAGSIGLIAPVATGIAPVLTPLAAAGLATIMAGATVLNLRAGRRITAFVNTGLMAMCAVVFDAYWK